MSSIYLTPKLKEGESVDLSLYSPRERTNIRLYGLACKDWTFQMHQDYKERWREAAEVVVVRGKLDKAKHWCKENLYMQDWHCAPFGANREGHLFYFKNPQEAMLFKMSI